MTHCRTGTGGITWSTRWAAVCAMCRPLHEGHTPRRLHEKATTNVCVHCVQTARANPKQKQPAREVPVELLFDVARNGLLAG
jgi:hypothetical protein